MKMMTTQEQLQLSQEIARRVSEVLNATSGTSRYSRNEDGDGCEVVDNGRVVILGQVNIDDKPSWIQGVRTTELEKKIAALVTETMTVQLIDMGIELKDMITEVKNVKNEENGYWSFKA